MDICHWLWVDNHDYQALGGIAGRCYVLYIIYERLKAVNRQIYQACLFWRRAVKKGLKITLTLTLIAVLSGAILAEVYKVTVEDIKANQKN